MLPFRDIYIYIYGKRNFRKAEMANFRLFSVSGKRKFVFFGRQTTKGNRRLTSQETCSSMLVTQLFIQWWTHYFYKVAGLLCIRHWSK